MTGSEFLKSRPMEPPMSWEECACALGDRGLLLEHFSSGSL